MINNEQYIKLLKSMIACVSHGDYSSIKELSNLELKNMKQREETSKNQINQININKKLKNNKQKPLENWENEELRELIECYSQFVLQQIEKTNNLKQLKKEAISIQEFINKM